MYTIDSSCRRRGTSTILGTLIFVGIIFTSFIPMMLLMNQADTLHEMRKHEVARFDEERTIENIFFHLETSIVSDEPIITLVIYNRCEIAVRIVHVWINGELREVNYLIPPTSQDSWELSNLVAPPYEDTVSFTVMVVTDMGNIFLPPSGIPEYSYDEILGGNWEHEVFTIYIMMTDTMPQLHLLVIFDPDVDAIIIVDEDLENNQVGYTRSVPFAGDYLIIVTQFHDYDDPLFTGTRTLDSEHLVTLVII